MSEPEIDLFTVPFHATERDYPHGAPDNVVVRELDFRIHSNDLIFYFSRGRDFKLSDENTSIGAVLAKLRLNDFRFHQNRPRLRRPYSTDLSLCNGELSWVIYRLRPDRNWQFWRVGWPISVGAKGHGKKAYYDAYRMDRDGGHNRGDQGDPALDGAKLAYMIADGTTLLGETEPMHAVNLHVELTFKDGDGNDSYIPMIIDPDIRFPGGSVSEGP